MSDLGIIAILFIVASVLACLLTKPGKQADTDVPATLADDGNPIFRRSRTWIFMA